MYKILMVAPGQLAKGGIVNVVKYYKNHSFWETNKIKWIETHCTGSKLKKLYFFITGLLVFLFYLPQCKIVHIHLSGGISAYRKYVFYVFSQLLGKKIVAHIHQGTPSSTLSKEKTNKAFRAIIEKASKVILLSENLKNTYNNLFKREYIVLNNPSQGFSDVALCEKEQIVLFAGRIEKAKGGFDLLEAINILNKKFTLKYKFVLAGNGEISKAKQFVVEHKLDKIVEVPGWLETDDILPLFKRADIFILPSYWEGFPISIIDALSHKCSVITTPVGGIPQFLEHMKTCLFVKPGEIDEIAFAITQLMDDTELRNTLAQNGFLLAKTSFDIDKITSTLSSVYEDLLN